MKKFIITEEEKDRILNMHKSRTSNQYLNEEPTPTGTDWYTACMTFNKLPENKRNLESFRGMVGQRDLADRMFMSFTEWCPKINEYDKTNFTFNQVIDNTISRGGDTYKGYDQFPNIVKNLSW